MAIKKIKDKKVDEPTTKIRVTEDRINDANSLDVSFIEGNQNKANKEKILKEIEDKISYARQFYNDSAMSFNNLVQMFPSNIVASMFGFKKFEYFKAEEKEKEVPKVEF